MASGDIGTGWANYSAYAADVAETIGRNYDTVAVRVAGTEIRARTLTVVEDTLVVGVLPTEVINNTFSADQPVLLSTPEETVTARLRDITFDIEGVLLSFERVEN
jgi:hypothetical protein